MQLIVQALHTVRNGGVPAILGRIDSAANPVSTLLDAVLQVVLLHAAESFAHFVGGIRLSCAKSSRSFLHLLFKPAERVGGLLAIVTELGLLIALAQPIAGVATRKHLAHARFLILLLFLKPVRFASHAVHLLRGFSLLQAAQ